MATGAVASQFVLRGRLLVFVTAILRILENGECRTVRSRSAQFAGQTWLSETL
jgi:hypothetical protein